jgi:hypothetical protein
MKLQIMVAAILLAGLPHVVFTAQPTRVSARNESKIQILKRNLQKTWKLYRNRRDNLSEAKKKKLERRLRTIRRALIALGVTAVTIASILGYKRYRRKRLEYEVAADTTSEQQRELDRVKEKFDVDEDIALKVLDAFKTRFKEAYMEKIEEDIKNYNSYKNGSRRDFHSEFLASLGGFSFPRGGYYWLFKGKAASCPRFKQDADPEDMQKMVKVYKIHLMPQTKDINNTVARLMMSEEIRNNVGEIKLKQELTADQAFPILVLYACQGKDQAQKLLDMVCGLFKGKEGLNILPRYNKRVTSLIYFAQGNGDDKKDLEDQRKLNRYFTSDGVYYSRKINEAGNNPEYELRGCGG